MKKKHHNAIYTSTLRNAWIDGVVAARDVNTTASVAAILVILPPSCAYVSRVTASTCALLSLFASTVRVSSPIRLSASLEIYSPQHYFLSVLSIFINIFPVSLYVTYLVLRIDIHIHNMYFSHPLIYISHTYAIHEKFVFFLQHNRKWNVIKFFKLCL